MSLPMDATEATDAAQSHNSVTDYSGPHEQLYGDQGDWSVSKNTAGDGKSAPVSETNDDNGISKWLALPAAAALTYGGVTAIRNPYKILDAWDSTKEKMQGINGLYQNIRNDREFLKTAQLMPGEPGTYPTLGRPPDGLPPGYMDEMKRGEDYRFGIQRTQRLSGGNVLMNDRLFFGKETVANMDMSRKDKLFNAVGRKLINNHLDLLETSFQNARSVSIESLSNAPDATKLQREASGFSKAVKTVVNIAKFIK